FRRAATEGWAVSVAGSMGMPACGTQHEDMRGQSSLSALVDQNSSSEDGKAAKKPKKLSKKQKVGANGAPANRKKTPVSDKHGFEGDPEDVPTDIDGIALVYTGRALAYKDCDGKTGHLNDYFDQGKLLSLYENGQGWF